MIPFIRWRQAPQHASSVFSFGLAHFLTLRNVHGTTVRYLDEFSFHHEARGWCYSSTRSQQPCTPARILPHASIPHIVDTKCKKSLKVRKGKTYRPESRPQKRIYRGRDLLGWKEKAQDNGVEVEANPPKSVPHYSS